MSEPSQLERFIRYAQAFELAQAADAWSVLEPLFAEDAVHRVHDGGSLGGDDRGRDAVLAGLRQSVLAHDRRFDLRLPEILEGPLTRSDGIWMRYRLTLRRAGLPELAFEGEHLSVHADDGRIRRIEEWLDPATPRRVAEFLEAYAAALRPAGAPPSLPVGRDLRDLQAAAERSLVRIYGCAKSQQDVGAALAVCSDDFALETPAFGTRGVGRAEVAAQLTAFFQAFPDYRVELEGLAQGDALAAWGRARLSLRGAIAGLAPTHKTAELGFVSLFDVADGSLRGERFLFDRAELCEQLGIAPAALAEALVALRRSPAEA